MAEIRLGPISGSPVPRCPDCGSPDIEVVRAGSTVNFLCRSCWTCWHFSLGWLSRVVPTSCDPCVHCEECLQRSPVVARVASAIRPDDIASSSARSV
jgi:hypothetical protein